MYISIYTYDTQHLSGPTSEACKISLCIKSVFEKCVMHVCIVCHWSVDAYTLYTLSTPTYPCTSENDTYA